MGSNTLIRSLVVVGSALGVVGAANAALVDPYYLLNGTSGEDSVQTLMTNNGFGGSVGQISSNAPGNILNYGDQTNNDTFVINAAGASQTWSRLWGIAGQAAGHAIGYYTNIGAGTINPGDITWVLWGGSNVLGLGTPGVDHWTDSVSGSITNGTLFSLVFSTGIAGEFFYSQAARNPGGVDFVSTVKDFTSGGGSGSWNGGLITAWEDQTDIQFRDYNDFAIDIQGARSVPEPATMATLALGAAALIRRRRAVKK